MLSFRNGAWRTIPVVLTDPLFSEEHRQQLAAAAATSMAKGLSVQNSIAKAETIIYMRLFPGLVSREQHGPP